MIALSFSFMSVTFLTWPLMCFAGDTSIAVSAISLEGASSQRASAPEANWGGEWWLVCGGWMDGWTGDGWW